MTTCEQCGSAMPSPWARCPSCGAAAARAAGSPAEPERIEAPPPYVADAPAPRRPRPRQVLLIVAGSVLAVVALIAVGMALTVPPEPQANAPVTGGTGTLLTIPTSLKTPPATGTTPGTTGGSSGSRPTASVTTTSAIAPGGPRASRTGAAHGRPMIGNGHTFFFEADELVARDLRTGVDAWHAPLPCDVVEWVELLRSTAINPLVLQCDATLHAFDWSTGAERWEAELPEREASFTRSSSNSLLFGYPDNVIVFDLETGAERWQKQIPKGREDTHPIALDDAHVYVAEDDLLHAYDARTSQLAWTKEHGVATMITGDGKLFVRTDGHRVLAIDPAQGTTIWTTQTKDLRLNWSMLVGTTDGTLIARNRAGFLVAYDSANGAERWSSPDGVRTTPGQGSATTVPIPSTITPQSSDMGMSFGGGFVVTNGRHGRFLIRASTGLVIQQDAERDAARVAVDDGFLAYVARGELVVAPLP